MANAFGSNIKNQQSRIDDHIRFICPECGEENYSQQDWLNHLNVVHSYSKKTVKDFNFRDLNNKFHECQTCKKWVANGQHTIAALQYHYFMHLPFPRTHECRYCSSAFTRKSALCEHLNKSHLETMTQIDAERQIQEVQKISDNQSPLHNNDFYMKFVCPLCGQLFDRYNIWQQHIDVAHSATSVDLRLFRIQSTKNYYCAQCTKTLYDDPTKTELQRHNFTHQPFPLYFKCSYCSITKSYKTEVLLHFVKTHKDEFEKYKQYIKKPIEWGGRAEENILKELDTFLGANRTSTQADILQEAIQNSLIDLEDEIKKESIYKHEYALDESLQELDEILSFETKQDLRLIQKENTTDLEMNEEEFEELCNEMFEEEEGEQYSNNSDEELTQPNKKRIKLDLLATESPFKITDSIQKEMQKYIHYLCPECGEEFQSQPVWRDHVFQEHNLVNAVETKFRPIDSQKTQFICLICHKVQHTAEHTELRRHHFEHMPYQIYLKCAICAITKSSKPKILQHMQYEHLKEIQRSTPTATTKTMAKNYHCLDCDKLYAQRARFEAHCRQCPQRLIPLAVGLYDIEKNMKLLEHLKKASVRIEKYLAEEGIVVSSTKLS